MTTSIDREALYAAVWTDPVRVVAARLGISDVALKKACQRAVIRGSLRIRADRFLELPDGGAL